MKKRLFAGLLVLSMLASLLVPTGVYAEDYIVLTFGEEVVVTLAIDETKWYQFTPDATGTYSFVSYNEDGVDPVANLYDTSMEPIASGDDHDGANFCIVAELTAGETYYLEAYEYGFDNEGSYALKVTETMPTDVFFDEYAVETFVGVEYALNAYVYPEDSNDTLTWTSSNEMVATVDENGKVTFLAAGEVMITAETVNGLSDNCWFTVHEVSGSLEPNTEYTLEFTGFETRQETQRYFTFTPDETGYYCLYSYDIYTESGSVEIDPRCWVFDELYGELAYNDDGGEEVNVRAEVALTAGETYYFMLELYDSKAIGSIKYILKKMVTADSVRIDCGDLVLDQGSYFDIYVTYSPADAWQEDYVVTSSDASVIKVEDKTILAVGDGEATVTVTSDLGLTDSITVTVIGIDELELGTPVTLEGNAYEYGASGRYAFTPATSGRYTISSSEAIGEDAMVSVSVSNAYNQLRYNNNGSNTFSLTYVLNAGETYYYDVNLSCEAEESSVDFVLTKTDDEIPAAKLNTNYLIDITNPGDGAYYSFTPTKTGLYAIMSLIHEDLFDTTLYVYNSDWDIFYSNDDGAGNSQYRLEEEFIAGETYYLKSNYYSNDDAGSHIMRIEPLFSVQGDINGDCVLDTSDAKMALSAILEQCELTEEQQQFADMNKDGKFNSADVRAMLVACVSSTKE